jgi:hypothetical protein
MGRKRFRPHLFFGSYPGQHGRLQQGNVTANIDIGAG